MWVDRYLLAHSAFTLQPTKRRMIVQMLELISYALTGLGAILVVALWLDLH
jgi:hypothetical protein